jgi:hypothetical protein
MLVILTPEKDPYLINLKAFIKQRFNESSVKLISLRLASHEQF